MKYLGLDYGTKRIGLAISDDMGQFAFPKAIIPSDSMALTVIADIVRTEKVEAIVIGESLATNEIKNALVKKSDEFGILLKEKLALPVFFQPEGFSTVEAHRYQVSKGNRDDSAAAIILQRFLDKIPK